MDADYLGLQNTQNNDLRGVLQVVSKQQDKVLRATPLYLGFRDDQSIFTPGSTKHVALRLLLHGGI